MVVRCLPLPCSITQYDSRRQTKPCKHTGFPCQNTTQNRQMLLKHRGQQNRVQLRGYHGAPSCSVSKLHCMQALAAVSAVVLCFVLPTALAVAFGFGGTISLSHAALRNHASHRDDDTGASHNSHLHHGDEECDEPLTVGRRKPSPVVALASLPASSSAAAAAAAASQTRRSTSIVAATSIIDEQEDL